MEDKIFLIVNQGLHPVTPKLKRVYGTDILVETISEGNSPLSIEFASQMAKKVRDVLMNYDDRDVYLIWSGMPVYNAVVYNVAKSILNKTPIILVYDKMSKGYLEFNIDARYLVYDV